MARPQRNNVDYFPFYCEEGKKMFYLEETYGNDGFAVFVKILRELARTDYHYLDLSKNTTLMFLSAKCKVTKEILLAIITDLVELEKFNKMLWSENSIVWCQDFIDSISDAYDKRKNECISYEGLVLLLISLGVRKPSKPKSKDPANPQTILKDTKEYNTKQYILTDFRECFNKWLLYKKEKKQSYKSEMSIESAYNQLVKLSGNNAKIAGEIIEQSIANNWAGLFELKQNTNQSKTFIKKQNDSDY